VDVHAPRSLEEALGLRAAHPGARPIAGGTDQMQRNAISEQVLGLPREPSWERDKPFDQVLREAQHWDGRIEG